MSPESMRPSLRIVAAAMLILFVSWAGFQYNDPDALLWMIIYGAAAVLTVLFLRGRFPSLPAKAYFGFCLIYAAYLLVRVVLEREFFFDEQGREMMGLVICAAWAGFLLRLQRPTRAARHST